MDGLALFQGPAGDATGDREDGVRAASLAAVEELRRELRASLRSVENNLRDAGAVTDGYDAAYFLNQLDAHDSQQQPALFRRVSERIADDAVARFASQRFDFDPPDSSRTTWKILPLGRAMCLRIWQIFDGDRDGAWSHKEFVEYMTAMERRNVRPDMHAIADSGETWRMYVSDSCEINADFCMTFPGFVAYRESIQAEYPLERDLELLDIVIEWPDLAKIRRSKTVFAEYAAASESEMVDIARLPYLLAEYGLLTTRAEIQEAIDQQRQFDKCLRSIRYLKKALRLFGYYQRSDLPFSALGTVEDPRVCKSSFRRLLFSAWSPSTKSRWRGLYLQTVLGSFGLLRRWQRNVSWTFEWIRKASKTGLLKASCLMSSPEEDRGDYVFKLDVGRAFSTRSTIHLTYNADADSASTLHDLKYLERGAECFVFVDITCRTSTRESDIQLVAQKLTWLIDEWFQDHLEALPFFFKWFVTIPSKLQLRSGSGGAAGASTSSPVIRLVVLFDGGLDLYQVMQSLHLPSSMQFDHLLQRLSFRLLCSHTLEELLTNRRLDIGELWACRGQLDVRLNRRAFAQILKQLATQIDSQAVQSEEVHAFVLQEREHWKEQQLSKNKQQQRSGGSNASSPTSQPGSSSTTSHGATGAKDESCRGFSRFTMRLLQLTELLEVSAEVSWTWAFDNLREILLGNLWVRSLLSPQQCDWLCGVLTTDGGLAAAWKAVGDSFRQEFVGMKYAQTSSGGGGPSQLTRTGSQSSLPSGVSESARANGLATSITASFPFAPSGPAPPTSNTPSHHGPEQQVSDTIAEEKTPEEVENELLELYDLCGKHLAGVHSIRAEAGTSGITCVLEGWNIFSLLPRVAQNQLRRRTSLGQTGSAVSVGVDSVTDQRL